MAETPTPPITDPSRIKALAHPVRMQLLDVLGDEEATATRCAELTGETVANCSFHLRTLAKHGFIEPAEPQGREKPWRLVERSHTVAPDWDDQTSVRAAQELATLNLQQEMHRLLTWIAGADRLSPEWVEGTTISRATIWVTAEELAELSARISELTEPFRGRREDPATRPQGARRAHLFATTTVDLDDETTGAR